jgi:hypothetical protein
MIATLKDAPKQRLYRIDRQLLSTPEKPVFSPPVAVGTGTYGDLIRRHLHQLPGLRLGQGRRNELQLHRVGDDLAHSGDTARASPYIQSMVSR